MAIPALPCYAYRNFKYAGIGESQVSFPGPPSSYKCNDCDQYQHNEEHLYKTQQNANWVDYAGSKVVQAEMTTLPSQICMDLVPAG